MGQMEAGSSLSAGNLGFIVSTGGDENNIHLSGLLRRLR